MNGQALESPGFIRDRDCTKDTPVTYGRADEKIYGKGKRIKPRIPGRVDTAHMRKTLLPELLPLEEYDLIVILLSGGKDSIACYLKLLELGVPKHKMEFWHHDIDGGNASRRMDWRCTQNYVKALAKAECVPLRVSWRVNGFFGELYRIGASEPIEWAEPGTGEVRRCKTSRKYERSQELKQSADAHAEEELKKLGCRLKFPMKTGDLSRRWCSAYLKIMIADAVIRNLNYLGDLGMLGRKRPRCASARERGMGTPARGRFFYPPKRGGQSMKVLIVSGERRGESPGRSKYNEMEIHRANATARSHRLVHQWRPVIDYSEKDVWELLRRHRITPHPCYRAGWNRCSCAMCIFSTPSLFAGIRELYPEEYGLLRQDEVTLGFALDNKQDLDAFVGDAKSCVFHGDKKALRSLITGRFEPEDIYVHGEWRYPAGAFHGTEGGPC